MKQHLKALLLGTVICLTIAPSSFADVSTDKTKSMQMKMQKVNVNTATLEELTALPGVGDKKAAAIIEYRTKFGKFTSLEQLAEVKGIGKKMLEKLAGQISI
ncbi:MAG: helix-hairpin-helix domain-containing protein [Paraglaciecola sp.]|nr:helix-hairpin-helix domain-containing protein [Paraglaciecola sp.]NCT48076.1 helix-hairpin-helix domain-containing protein [Paraglaciecola sp.]